MLRSLVRTQIEEPFIYIMINSRDIKELHPRVQTRCQAFLDTCKEDGIDILITSTYRDGESQNALFAQGRSKPGARVTNARSGQSYHNWRCAFDFVPIKNGKAIWNDPALFERCGAIAEEVGLEWAGHWVGFKEMAHCQWTNGLKIDDFKSGKTLDD